MGAPKGNQFWKLRSKHGRDKIFTSPDILWEEACKYFEWNEKNPLIEVDYKGKDAYRVELYKIQAFSLHGLCLFLGVNTAYFRQFKQGLDKNNENSENDFSTVITRIEETIYHQKFVGAAAGLLSPNIIARDLGLVDKKEIEKTEVLMSSEERDAKIKELLERANK
ncbi:terminase small subunit [Chryseobacterium sp. JK1]|uniref:terminase small subunit n=1 Tax=Chryseobacterium sp. JK1 TaxID=874294 RepID=UPI003D69AE13